MKVMKNWCKTVIVQISDMKVRDAMTSHIQLGK